MKSFRKEYKPDKQMYRLNGFPYALNNWVYECASAMYNEIAVREGNGIPRVCNWKVVGAKPKYEMFMKNIFTENDCSNVQPTQEELESLDLPNNSHVPPNRPATLVANQEEFSSKPPEQLLRRCTHLSTTGSTPLPKRRNVAYPTKNNVPKTTPDVQKNQPFQTPISQPLKFDNVSGVHLNTVPRRTSSDNARLEDLEGHIKSYDDQKIEALEALIIKYHSKLMKVVAAKDNKSDKDIGGICMPHIVDNSVDKGNVDLESASDQLFQQPISPIQMDFATVDHDGDAFAVEVEQRLVNEENVAKIDETSIKDQTMEDSTNVIPSIHHSDVPIEEFVHNKEMDSSKAASIPSGTETVIDAIVYKLPNEPINVAPLSVIIPPQLTNNDDFLSDSQLPTQLLIKKSAHNLDTKTPAPRNRIPSNILQSPYVNTFGSSDKSKGKIDDDIRPYTPFEGCGITYQVSSLLMQEYSQWIHKRLLKTHANKFIKDVINGFSVPAALPWHLVDEVYIPINCDEEFHWVLAVVVLRNRLIRVYDSNLGTRNKSQSDEIKQLSIILPNYLHDSGFFDKTDKIDCATLDAYKDNKTGEFMGPQHPFEVEFARGIMQQNSDSLDCGTYATAFAEFLSDEIKVPSIPFQSEYLCSRYATLLWKYGTDKANAGYVSENDDPIRLKVASILLADDELFNVE
ncbi:hypothetical protein KY285_002005 [Solanum tuberosum]|nr:hypothetical protein KY285_002005 [Solanum tuberosum]